MFVLLPAELGNAWANENTFTAAEGIIWFRYHNHVASELQREHPGWSDEELFQNARKTVVATFQVGGVCVISSLVLGWNLHSGKNEGAERLRGSEFKGKQVFRVIRIVLPPHRTLPSTNGCLHISETRIFLLIQVRITQSGTGDAPVHTSRGEGGAGFGRWRLTNMCTVSTLLTRHPQEWRRPRLPR